jgi:hypothetical protein
LTNSSFFFSFHCGPRGSSQSQKPKGEYSAVQFTYQEGEVKKEQSSEPPQKKDPMVVDVFAKQFKINSFSQLLAGGSGKSKEKPVQEDKKRVEIEKNNFSLFLSFAHKKKKFEETP